MNPVPGSTSTSYLPPEVWTSPEVVEDVIVADDVAIHRAGLSTTTRDGEEVCGSAADSSGSALRRARFELLERVSTIEALRQQRPSYTVMSEDECPLETRSCADVFPESDAPERWRFAKTNGIALHADWATACRRALWELAERDRVLRSWYGEIAPKRLEVDPDSVFPRTQSYEWCAYSFPETRDDSFSRGIEVVGVFGFPTRDERPFLLGLGARPDVKHALEAAVGEALQVLAFLWGEPQPPDELPLEPTAMFHLDAFQRKGRHAVVRRWLECEHLAYARGDDRVRRAPSEVGFVDLTPSWLTDGLRVAKAICRDAVPLVFGDAPQAGHLPPELRLHPIP
jgi:hypothetical protein